MPGPCSMPSGPKSEWEELNKLICESHPYCYPSSRNYDYKTNCRFVTVREWLLKRNRLRTGKTK